MKATHHGQAPQSRWEQVLKIEQKNQTGTAMIGTATRSPESHHLEVDTTFEAHYSIGDLAKRWRLGRETVRLLVKDEPGVLRIRMGRSKTLTRYSVPESVARRVHTKLFNPATRWAITHEPPAVTARPQRT